MQYRVLESLRYLNSAERIPAGTISGLGRLSEKSIAMLLKKGRITEVAAPPLAILEGFEGERAEAYAEQGILSVNDMTGDEPDFEEALAWSAAEQEGDGWMAKPLSVEGLVDVFELGEVIEDESVE